MVNKCGHPGQRVYDRWLLLGESATSRRQSTGFGQSGHGYINYLR